MARAEPVRHTRAGERRHQIPAKRSHRRLDSRPAREVEEVGLEELLALAEGNDLALEGRPEGQDERDRPVGAGEMAGDGVTAEARPLGEGHLGRGDRGDPDQPKPGGGRRELSGACRHRARRVPDRRRSVVAPAVAREPEDGPGIDGEPFGPPGHDAVGPELHGAHVSVDRVPAVP